MTTLLRLAWEKLSALVSRNRLDRDFDDELASHVELAIEDALARGLDPEARTTGRASQAGWRAEYQGACTATRAAFR